MWLSGSFCVENWDPLATANGSVDERLILVLRTGNPLATANGSVVEADTCGECWDPLATANGSVDERLILVLSAGIHWLLQMVLWMRG